MNVAFPLRDGYFRALQPTVEEETQWKEHVQGLVNRSLVEEAPYFASDYESIDRSQWKLVRRKDQLRVFSPRSGSSSHAVQCLLEIGTIEGTLEDVIYGVHNSTSHDMRVTTSFLSADALDAAVLHVFESGCEEDLFRSFALKWRILETPAGSLVKNRDVCALEYMGISYDCSGKRFAFHICESFEHPVCPPFNPQCVVRATTQTCIIYRQISPRRVGVYYRCEFTSGGRIPLFLARWTTAEVAVSIGRSVECAEAKKLTAIALATAESVGLDGYELTERLGKRDRVRSADAVRSCTICDHTVSHKSLYTCPVCRVAVCGKCRSRKYLLSDEGKIQVSCCKECLVVAKGLKVDARRPLAIISAAHWHSHGVIRSADAHSLSRTSTDVDPIDASPRLGLDPLTTVVEEERRGQARANSPRSVSSSFETDSSRRNAIQRANEKQRAREDVYDLLAAMSTTSEDTVTSIASREEGRTFSSDSVDGEDRSPPSKASTPVVRTSSTETRVAIAGLPLWEQIQHLRLTAEHTYRMTKQQSDEWTTTPKPRLTMGVLDQ